MAIENIQYVYGHTRLYRRALRPVNNLFSKRLQKEQQKETTKRNSIKTCRSLENAVEAVKPYLAPQNMFNSAFIEHQRCVIGLLIRRIGNK